MEVYNEGGVGQRRIGILYCIVVAHIVRRSFTYIVPRDGDNQAAIRRCVRVRSYILSIDDIRQGRGESKRPNVRWMDTSLIVFNLCRRYIGDEILAAIRWFGTNSFRRHHGQGQQQRWRGEWGLNVQYSGRKSVEIGRAEVMVAQIVCFCNGQRIF